MPQSYYVIKLKVLTFSFFLQFDDVPLVSEVEPDMVDKENAFGHGVNLDNGDRNFCNHHESIEVKILNIT